MDDLDYSVSRGPRKQFNIRLDPELMDQFDLICARHGWRKSKKLRDMINSYIKTLISEDEADARRNPVRIRAAQETARNMLALDQKRAMEALLR